MKQAPRCSRPRTSPSPLERLAGPGSVLAKEPPDGKEFAGLVRSGLARLKDAFQVLPDTLGLGPEVWRVLSKCHDMRNRTEYEGIRRSVPSSCP